MRLLTAQTINIIRRESSTLVRGEVVEGAQVALTIKGNLQPERNITLMREIFGAKVESAIKIFTKEKLRTYSKNGAADIVTYNDDDFEVSQVRRYDTIIPHYKIIAIRMKDEFGD